jgi:hypothetical protein
VAVVALVVEEEAMAVTPANIATELGMAVPSADSITFAQWDMWIADAVMLIEDRRIEVGVADALPQAKIDYVVRQAVSSHVRKPDDATTITIAVDDASSTRRYESGKGRVDVSGWWGYLGLDEGTDGAFSIHPAGNQTVTDPLTW